MARNIALIGTLLVLCLLGGLTVAIAVEHGIDLRVVVSLVLLALIGFGVLGALLSPPHDG